MYAEIGDRLVKEGLRTGLGERIGVIVEVRNSDGSPPYLVKWDSDGHESLLFPEPDTFVMRGNNIEV
jgi:Domain of unknown function (DUF1918)